MASRRAVEDPDGCTRHLQLCRAAGVMSRLVRPGCAGRHRCVTGTRQQVHVRSFRIPAGFVREGTAPVRGSRAGDRREMALAQPPGFTYNPKRIRASCCQRDGRHA